MPDLFDGHVAGLESPASRALAITPNDAADLPVATRALAVATSGFVQVTTVQGDAARLFIAAGVPFPIRARRIWATGTTATDIVGLA